MVINTNIQAIRATRFLNESQDMLSKSLSRLSSGSKIVSASDDAAGLAVSEQMNAQRARVDAAHTNLQNAISFVQTADGFMKGMADILTRMSELTMLAKDVTKNSSDVGLYNREFVALREQLRATIGGTEYGFAASDVPMGSFNGISLFGGAAGTFKITIGEGAGQTMDLGSIDLRSTGTKMNTLLNTSTEISVANTSARGAVIDAIQELAAKRAELGATQSRMEVASSTLLIQSENLEAAVSRIRDVDVADETTRYARYNILVQSGTAMLSQANQMPNSVLRLLQ